MSSGLAFICLISLTFLLSSCGPHDPPNQELSTGIIGGSDVGASNSVSSFTVGVSDEKAHSKCTGSLIAEDIVLTAAHCVKPGTRSFLLFALDFNDSNKRVPALSFVRHPLYNPNRSEGTDTFDLALIYFKSDLPSGFQSIALSSDTRTILQPGAQLIAAGFGLSNGLFGTGLGRLRQARIDFKEMIGSSEFKTVQNSTGVCSGDSGGPLFQMVADKWLQVGVASRVATKFLGCRNFAVYTRVDVYKNWILQTAQKLRDSQ